MVPIGGFHPPYLLFVLAFRSFRNCAMRFLCITGLCLFTSPGQAACYDDIPFGRTEVEICIGDRCEAAHKSTSCGNVHYGSEDYIAGSAIWMFWWRFHENETETDDEFGVLHDPIDPTDLPLQIEDGRPVYGGGAGVLLDSETVQQVTCVPKSRPDACEFIDAVLKNLRRR